jgi:hypothetical protein
MVERALKHIKPADMSNLFSLIIMPIEYYRIMKAKMKISYEALLHG